MSSKVVDIIEEVVALAKQFEVTLGMFTNTTEDAAKWFQKGVSLFLMRSDLSFITQGANDLVEGIRNRKI